MVLVDNKTHRNMRARARTHYVLVDAHMLSCMGHFQELAANQGVNIQ